MYENIDSTVEKIYIIQPILRENADKIQSFAGGSGFLD